MCLSNTTVKVMSSLMIGVSLSLRKTLHTQHAEGLSVKRNKIGVAQADKFTSRKQKVCLALFYYVTFSNIH